ncbi:MAG: hypothetical protein M1827_007758 [Pycnora praestabilis]|nr:MAG: hypothetical protein M1827_007758 [Pycnora praestabilis]
MSQFTIKVPASSANLGPGFDVIGLALSLWLELQISISESNAPSKLNCKITCEENCEGSEEIDLDPDRNLITRAALYILRCHDHNVFPQYTTLHIINRIPLGRGLGSSGAAVVAGIMLGNAVGRLGLTKDRMLDFCLMIERHPDNVAAALFGGFVGTYLSELNSEDMARKEVPLSEVLPSPAGGIDTGLKPPIPPDRIGHYVKFRWSPSIKTIVIIPDYEVSTAKAREVLPEKYTRNDVTFNMQRVALLTYALGQSHPDPSTIHQAMQDRIHQNYRQELIHGLETLRNLTPESTPGLLGICLSGAGPSILALATHNYDSIAKKVIAIINESADKPIKCDWKILEPAEGGASTEYEGMYSWLTRISNSLERTIRSRV